MSNSKNLTEFILNNYFLKAELEQKLYFDLDDLSNVLENYDYPFNLNLEVNYKDESENPTSTKINSKLNYSNNFDFDKINDFFSNFSYDNIIDYIENFNVCDVDLNINNFCIKLCIIDDLYIVVEYFNRIDYSDIKIKKNISYKNFGKLYEIQDSNTDSISFILVKDVAGIGVLLNNIIVNNDITINKYFFQNNISQSNNNLIYGYVYDPKASAENINSLYFNVFTGFGSIITYSGISFNICEDNTIRSYDVNAQISYGFSDDCICDEKQKRKKKKDSESDNNKIFFNYYNNNISNKNLIELNYKIKLSGFLDATVGVCNLTENGNETLSGGAILKASLLI